jgi:hypothetical protein
MTKFRQACWSVVGLALLGFGWACQDTTRPTIARTPMAVGKAAYDVSSPPPANPGDFALCKDTPMATDVVFTFDVVITTPDGQLSTQHYSLKSGHCLTFGVPGAGASFSVVEDLSATPGWTLASVTLTTGSGSQELSGNGIGTSGNPVVCSTNPHLGCVLVFHNIPTPPPDVCTDQNATNFGGPLPCVYPGKQFSIGPSSMEGAIRIDAGDWVNGGYSFKFVSAHSATNFTVNAFVTIEGPCRDAGGKLTGATDIITVPLGTNTYAIPASSKATDWLPTGDANNVLSWAGSIVAPAGLCGGGGNSLDASRGAVYHATVLQSPSSGSLVDFRFKFRDPAAKGKPNTNCLDTSDPNRAKADVCGASWSETVRDP